MSSTKIVHIIGIGGIGMSAIAEILHNSGYKVQGSDVQSNNNIDRLKKLGMKVYIGHNADNISQAQTVIYSSAIRSDNVELIAAKSNNKTILHRSDILAELLRNKYVIAVSGSSGKTTTTAMIASIFDHSNIDATVIVGGILNSYQSNSKLGKSNIFLIEADESDGTMLKILANIAVITSINDDHIDHYGTFDDIKEAFSQFINKADFAVLPDFVDINYDGNNTVTFGFESANTVIPVLDTGIQKKDVDSNTSYLNDTEVSNVRASNIRQYANSIEFDVLNNWIPVSRTGMTPECIPFLSSQCVTLGSRSVQIDSSSLSSQCATLGSRSAQIDSPSPSSYHPLSSQCVTLGSRIIKDVILSNAIGIHKVSNALAAISVAVKLGISEESIRKGLAEFKGVARRFSLIADVNGVKLIEDYAHHPDEIQATLTAARSIDFLRNSTSTDNCVVTPVLKSSCISNTLRFSAPCASSTYLPEANFARSLITRGKVVGIIEPLRFARVRNFFDEFIRIFMMFDYIILTTVHPPEDETIPGCGIDDIQKALINNGFDNVKIMNDSLLISRFINSFTNSGDVVLFIGAGSNIAKLAKETAEHMTKVKV